MLADIMFMAHSFSRIRTPAWVITAFLARPSSGSILDLIVRLERRVGKLHSAVVRLGFIDQRIQSCV
jgi:hypothetical protein